MRAARVRLAGSSAPFDARCQIKAGCLHCEVERSKRPAEFEWTGPNEVRIVRETVRRTWPMEQVAHVDWLEEAA